MTVCGLVDKLADREQHPLVTLQARERPEPELCLAEPGLQLRGSLHLLCEDLLLLVESILRSEAAALVEIVESSLALELALLLQ